MRILRDPPTAVADREGVVLGRSGQVEKGVDWRHERGAVNAADALGGAGEVEQGDERRGVAPAAVAADRRGTRFGDEPRTGGASQFAAAFRADAVRFFRNDSNRQPGHLFALRRPANDK